MDVNTSLSNQRILIDMLRTMIALGNPIEADTVSDLLDATEAIDTWLSRGGFLPGAWAR